MAVGEHALTTLAELKDYLNISGSGDDSILESLIDRVTALFESYTGRKLKARDYHYDPAEAAYDPENAVLDGDGGSSLILPQYPVNSITTLRVMGSEIPEATSYAATGWINDGNLRSAGILRLRGYTLSAGRAFVEIAYNAGYGAVPDDLAQAAIEQAAWKFREGRKGELGIQSHTLPDGSVTFRPTDLLPSVQGVLSLYKSRFAL